MAMRRGNLPKEATALLKKWFQDHAESPYPSDEEKTSLATSTGLSQAQISNWFINARRRNPGKEAREMTRAMNNNRSSGQQQAQGTNGSQEQDLSVQPSASSSPQQTRPSQQHREQHYVLPQIAAPQPYHYDPRDHKQDRDHEMGNT
ncbi:hypothetical protein SLS55_007317 [Diplodia seriata]|uniref:Homeobox domain-containing protein n=1 Tax=Diplodia seriata TaxID=420778 RepID=A0ABR3CBZ3_9PEZI